MGRLKLFFFLGGRGGGGGKGTKASKTGEKGIGIGLTFVFLGSLSLGHGCH